MSDIKNGGPAFPLANSHIELAGTNWEHANGLTLRDYFAAKAMQGICAHPDTWGLGGIALAVKSYEIADEMLRAREA